jgi:hypothetical protein
MEHSERPLGILVDVGYHESQVHTPSQLFFRAEDVAGCRIYSCYSRKEIVAAATVMAARPPATFLETAVPSRTDMSLLVQASEEALSLHGRYYDRARLVFLRDIPCGVYCCAKIAGT